ncbi:phage holin family protein [Dickeya solani]|uniref:Phage holin family protein n=1 Tax=Dickeya solani TaxID=1089444 RepID=A0ABU4EL68_9GAMM|nr:phage holin family protein [Dickeya solani]MCA6998202.1 phage holin family protein [Dickeya solani]MDV6997167.1 phage holin family protein [Dickeya solani]MDV7004478.1 phage holin family protein [Dickeya solani]MDV7040360.1 phage holin family protein [Dickeya solani]MDV7044811.1 phage holin family protein [Dickeya solani]
MANEPITVINVVVSAVIALRLMFFRKSGARHCAWASWLAYGMVLAYGFIPISWAFGQYHGTNPAALGVNIVIAALVLRARGNAAKLLSRNL